MPTPLLTTKLFLPPPRPNWVPRPRLLQRLDDGLRLGHRLSLVSAPAGFGKSTLLSEWVAQLPIRAAWLSLDEGDNDGAWFWSYLIAALQTVQAGLGQDLLPLLRAPQRPAAQAILTPLLNDMAALPGRVVLVLDDYHRVFDRAIHEGLAFLLEHQPGTLHVVISTRADPPLPTYRLRARGQLTELRSTDLRFTASEAQAFLNATMGLNLTREEVEALEARTEGWIVGLQLAALSLQGRADAGEFITAFGGGHHYVLEYLTHEVVRRQPERVQRFLLQTSILNRLCGPLCDAVTGERDGEAVLAHLQQRNLFVVPLDDQRRWVRYHHLFADLLGNLRRTEWPPEQIQELHRRASVWYEGHDLAGDAMHHALAAGDVERTAGLIERHSLAMVTRGELVTLLRWIDALPPDVALSRPWLCVHQAWPLILADDAEGAEPLLRQIEQRVAPGDPRPDAPEILGHVAAMRAMRAIMHGDLPPAVGQAHRADELLPADDVTVRHIIPFALGSAHYAAGELPDASQALAEELTLGRAADNLWTVVRALCDLADVEIVRGRLGRATELCQAALQEAEARGGRQFGTVGYGLVKLGELCYARGDVVTAREHIQEGVRLMQGWQQPYEMVAGYTSLAAVLQAGDDARGAREALDRAESIRAQHPTYRKLSSLVYQCQIQLCLAQDGPDDAAYQAREVRLGETGPLIFREQEQMVWAQVLIAQRRWDEVQELLAALAADTEAGGRFGRRIEVLALQAVARQLQGDTAGALAALEEALALAEPEGPVRVFVDLGPPMATLLQRAAARDTTPAYAARLLAVLGGEPVDAAAVPSRPPAPPLAEPLSGRELEVLHLIGQGCTNKQIAEALVVSVNTVKKHAGNIYGKLGVHNRTQAVARAQELGLL